MMLIRDQPDQLRKRNARGRPRCGLKSGAYDYQYGGWTKHSARVMHRVILPRTIAAGPGSGTPSSARSKSSRTTARSITSFPNAATAFGGALEPGRRRDFAQLSNNRESRERAKSRNQRTRRGSRGSLPNAFNSPTSFSRSRTTQGLRHRIIAKARAAKSRNQETGGDQEAAFDRRALWLLLCFCTFAFSRSVLLMPGGRVFDLT